MASETKPHVSHRSTTSSRSPGYGGGSVQVQVIRAAPCPKCKGIMASPVGAHAPRYVGGRLVDCVGDEVPDGGKR